jgi:hypothetical protein
MAEQAAFAQDWKYRLHTVGFVGRGDSSFELQLAWANTGSIWRPCAADGREWLLQATEDQVSASDAERSMWAKAQHTPLQYYIPISN